VTVRTKVCGVTRREDVALVARAGADAVGVVADVPVDTPREVSVDEAASLLAAAPPFCSTVLVTMPATVDAAVDLAGRVDPDVLQVHGEFAPAELATLRGRLDARLVPVVPGDDGALERARAVAEVDAADAILLDTPTDSGGGGTGETHDWTAARRVVRDVDLPVVLAGGLGPDNVARAVRTVRPFAVDVASGVESSGGVKEPAAVEAFVRRARAAGGPGDGDGDGDGGEKEDDGAEPTDTTAADAEASP
jgi:phosphoribosylanthranilate isomerase